MLINISSLKYVTLVLLISSCNSSKNVSGVNSGTENSYKVATLIKTACYGSCPVYEMTIYSNLVVEFSGERFVNNIGKFTSRIAQSDLQDLQDAFFQNEFFQLEDEYTSLVSDLPTTFVYYSDGKKSKTVKDYTGAPESLKELEKLLEGFVESLEWVAVKED